LLARVGDKKMDKFDRIFDLHKIFSSRRTAVSMQQLIDKLEGCNKSTVHRLIALMRDRMGAPIEFDKEQNGYRYYKLPDGKSFELPGLWFNGAELQALLVMQNVLANLGAGLLDEHLAPLGKRLNEMMQHRRLNLGDAAMRVRAPALAARPVGDAFQIVAAATLQRKQLQFSYHSGGNNDHTQRTVSPQRVIHYRECWYLDAWDEGKQALRSFAIDRMAAAHVLKHTARDVDEATLDEHYATGYGIFGGTPDKVAVLHFSAERARWVADEQWHPGQQSQYLPDGRYELKIPYSDSRELILDILRHGAEVEVIDPPELRAEVARQLVEAARLYSGV
jgi:proteasome accessory factor C